MSTLDVYAMDALQNSRSRFMAIYKRPFLLHKRDSDASVDEQATSEQFAQRTQVAMSVGKTGTIAVLGRNARLYAVYELKRSTHEAHAESERISIGRSFNNDVVIVDNAVSKRHAYFRQCDNGDMFLADAGSRNGTLVGGRKLTVGSEYPVDFGEPILLGGLALTLIGSGALWEVVQAHAGAGHATIDYIGKS